MLPKVVNTYAPRGQTPVLREGQTRDHLAALGGGTPAGRVYGLVREAALKGLHTITFLEHVRRHAGERMLVIWDGSPIQRRVEVADFLNSTAGRGRRVEAQPGYAPDLNPWDAGGWQHLKQGERRTRVCLDLEELHLQLHLAISRLRQKPAVIQGFFPAAGLAL